MEPGKIGVWQTEQNIGSNWRYEEEERDWKDDEETEEERWHDGKEEERDDKETIFDVVTVEIDAGKEVVNDEIGVEIDDYEQSRKKNKGQSWQVSVDNKRSNTLCDHYR